MLTSGVGKEEAEARQTVTDQAGWLKASVSQPEEEAGWVDAPRSDGAAAASSSSDRDCVQLGQQGLETLELLVVGQERRTIVPNVAVLF